MNERKPRVKLSGHVRGLRHGIAAVRAQINRALRIAQSFGAAECLRPRGKWKAEQESHSGKGKDLLGLHRFSG